MTERQNSLATIALITPAHLTNDPRLVKEAAALADEGYRVHVFACQYLDWATKNDYPFLNDSKWQTHLVCYSAAKNPYLFWKSRVRQHACTRILRMAGAQRGLTGRLDSLATRAFDRVGPELCQRVLRQPADLYIGHNLQALPIAVTAARQQKAKAGFDAEDFHSGMKMPGRNALVHDAIVDYLEQQYLPKCDYVSTASAGIAQAYAGKFRMALPTPILNVFPIAYRPTTMRPTENNGPLKLYWFSQTIGAHRGLEAVVRALGLLKACDVELHLRGNWQHGFQDTFFDLARTAGVDVRRIILHDTEPACEMVRLAANYDVGLASEVPVSENRAICMNDFSTNKFYTYLLAGNAIAASTTQPAETVFDGAGLAYPPGAFEALARGLRLWHDDRAALDKARRKAWELGAMQYNWDIEKKKFLALIDRTLRN